MASTIQGPIDTDNMLQSKASGKMKTAHACHHCGKSYTRRSDLVVHERIHTGEKPFKCEECDKAFSKRSHLTRHEKIHSGEKPYRCGLCGKLHSRANDLKVHLRSHTGERPYVCKTCNKKFITSSHLRMHERTHDTSRCLPCPHCTKEFKTKPGLKQHVKAMHSDTTVNVPLYVPDSQPQPVQKQFVGDNGTSAVSLETMATACPQALKLLVDAGVVHVQTKDAGMSLMPASNSPQIQKGLQPVSSPNTSSLNTSSFQGAQPDPSNLFDPLQLDSFSDEELTALLEPFPETDMSTLIPSFQSHSAFGLDSSWRNWDPQSADNSHLVAFKLPDFDEA